jgi:hypothetical protein
MPHPPQTEVPVEYARQLAESRSRTGLGATRIACWACVLLGLFVPVLSLGGAGWAIWMSREDRRFTAPAIVGGCIVVFHFLLALS